MDERVAFRNLGTSLAAGLPTVIFPFLPSPSIILEYCAKRGLGWSEEWHAYYFQLLGPFSAVQAFQ